MIKIIFIAVVLSVSVAYFVIKAARLMKSGRAGGETPKDDGKRRLAFEERRRKEMDLFWGQPRHCTHCQELITRQNYYSSGLKRDGVNFWARCKSCQEKKELEEQQKKEQEAARRVRENRRDRYQEQRKKKDKMLAEAARLERCGRLEEAALCYEALKMWDEAGRVRKTAVPLIMQQPDEGLGPGKRGKK